MILPIVRQGLVESAILFSCNISGVAGPDGFGFIKLFLFDFALLDLLGLLLLLFVFFLIFVNLFYLGLLLSVFLIGLFGVLIRDFLFSFLGDM